MSFVLLLPAPLPLKAPLLFYLIMKTFVSLLISLILTFWMITGAIVSIQNAETVSLRFLTFESIQIPFGLLLTFSAATGIIGISLLRLLWGFGGVKRNAVIDDDAEFFADDGEL